MKGGIAGRFSLIFSLLILLATGTVGYMVYWGGRESLMGASTNRLAHTADIIDVRLSASLEAVAKDVRFLAATPPVKGIVRARTLRGLDPEMAIRDDEWQDLLTEIFVTFLENRPSYVEAMFVELHAADAAARPLVRVVRASGAIQRSGFGADVFARDESHYRAALERAALTRADYEARVRRADSLRAYTADSLGVPLSEVPAVEVVASETVLLSEIRPDSTVGGAPTLRAAIPVQAAAGEVFGVVMIRVDARDLIGTLHALIDRDKTLLLANPDGTLLSSLPDTTLRPATLQGLFPQVTPLIADQIKTMQVETVRDEDGTSLIGHFERIRADYGAGHLDLVLGVTAPHAVILDFVLKVRNRSVLITLLFALGGSLLALGLTGYLTRPLSRITRAVSRFGIPGWRDDLPLSRADELGVLARAFDTMADQIQDHVSALEDKERRQRIILETSAEGILVADDAGRIETFNSAAERIFGYRADEVVGMSLGFLIEMPDQMALPPPEGAAAAGAAIVLTEDGGRLAGGWREVTGRRRDGSTFPLWLALSAFSFGGRRKYAGFCHDITERKRYEEALEQAKEHAEDMARLKSAFLANMSHEIRTPLTSIIGYASALAKHASDDHRRFAELIERSGRRLMDTLNAVLALAQFEAKSVRVDLAELDVAAETGEVVQLFEGLAERKDLTLRYSVAPGAAGVTARLDRGALSSVLQNLIGNAIKFTKEGSVHVRVDADDVHVHLSVADTGVGIHDAFLPHLFDEFRQESSGLNRSHEGSGLGLAITRRLVQLMDGAIDVSSRKGEGSTFTVSFPRALPDAGAEDADADGPSAVEAAGGDGAVAAPVGRPRVLLVEDNPDTAFLILHLLLDTCDVLLATNAEHALRTAASNRFDLLLLDINLGGGPSGIDLLERLRALPGYDRTPAAAVTAYALPGDRERFHAAGFDAYLAKPFTAAELLRLSVQLLPQPAP